MARQDFYETLGLQRGASAKDIKSAYYQVLDVLERFCLHGGMLSAS